MCGIAGVSLRSGGPPGSVVEAMSACLVHRGPDGSGLYRNGSVALAHRRLSILDLEGGAQPIASADERVHIVANGEIYNYRTLQREIRDGGDSLRTDSDSEVPLHLWRRHGMSFVQRLEGMYALALYDEETEDLVLARDPVGIKPLYVSETGEGIAFASEAGAIVRSGWIEPAVEPGAWPSYFNRQYVSGSLTMFRGVRRMVPGEVLRIRHGRVVERRVFPLELTPPVPVSEREALETLDALTTEVVRSHLQSDVPYGAFLSGGIDSTCVVTKMAQLVGGEVRTFAIGFTSDTVSDERHAAEALSVRLRTRHATAEFSNEDFWGLLPEMCRVMDDLAADYAVLPTLKLARLAGQHVKVILSGEGGDEGFAGYTYYGAHRQHPLHALIRGWRFRKRGNTHGFHELFRDPEITGWRDGAAQDRFDTTGFTRLQTYQARDLSDWLPDDLMLKVDRCLMAYGIEGRVPLLDRKLLAFAFSLPDALKISGEHHKYLLRKWVEVNQPQQDPWGRKRGFTVPIHPWLEARRDRLRPYLTGHEGVAEALHAERVDRWLSSPLDRRGAKLLFNVLCYALWHDVHIQGKSDSGANLLPERIEAAGAVQRTGRG